MGKIDLAVDQFQKAIALQPTSAEYSFNLGYALEQRGDFAGAVAPLQKSVDLSEAKNWRCLAELGNAYNKTGHTPEAIQSVRQALDLALQAHQDALARNLQEIIDGYQKDTTKAQP